MLIGFVLLIAGFFQPWLWLALVVWLFYWAAQHNKKCGRYLKSTLVHMLQENQQKTVCRWASFKSLQTYCVETCEGVEFLQVEGCKALRTWVDIVPGLSVLITLVDLPNGDVLIIREDTLNGLISYGD